MSATNGNSNGHAGSAPEEVRIPVGTHPSDFNTTNTSKGAGHPLSKVIGENSPSGAILQMQTGLFELARTRARLGGATKPVLEDQKALEEHARAMARETYRERFD